LIGDLIGDLIGLGHFDDVSYSAADAGMGEFAARYRFPEKFMALCRECDNYAANWACPPFGVGADDFLRGYAHVYVFGVKAVHPENAVRAADTREKAVEYLRGIFMKLKAGMLDILFEIEREHPGSAGVSAGGCAECPKCARNVGSPCRFPGKPRRSLESLGFDVSMISEEMSGMKLLWMNGMDKKIPAYSVLVNALFSPAGDASILDGLKSRLHRLTNNALFKATG
jgi:predicted metal-binding protein